MQVKLNQWLHHGFTLCLLGLACFAVTVSAADAQPYADRIAADKRDIAAYIGLVDQQIAAGEQKAAEKTQKKALRYARVLTEKLELRTQGIRIWGLSLNDKKALREYKRGVRVKGSDQYAPLHLSMARVYNANRQFESAKAMLRLSLAADAMNNEAAESLLLQIQQVERAVAITNSSFAYDAQINREAVARLLNQELSVAQYLDLPKAVSVGETSDQGLTDYEGSTYAADILSTHRLNLRSFRITNGAFLPQKAISRGELALLVEDILYVKFGISRTAFIGTASPFSDLSSSNTSFNAIMSAVTRGLMQGRENGSIGPSELVTGAETILVLHNLNQILKRPQAS